MGSFLKALPAVLAALVIAMAQTGPDDTASNISKWAAQFGIDGLPAWLSAKATDVWFLSAAALFLAVYVTAAYFVAPRVKARLAARRQGKGKPLKISYENKINCDGKVGICKTSSTAIAAGLPLQGDPITENRFYVGVTNMGSATLRNVTLVINNVAPPPTPVRIHLVCARTGLTNVDIPPGGEELFLIFRGFDSNQDGFHRADIMDPQAYDALKRHVDANRHVGGDICTAPERGIPLLRNDGNIIDLCANADDSVPDFATVVINAKLRLSLYVHRNQEISDGALKAIRGDF